MTVFELLETLTHLHDVEDNKNESQLPVHALTYNLQAIKY